MAAFVFIHGAGDAGWYWQLMAAEPRERGRDAIAPDLPCDDDSAGLPEYADTMAAAAGDRTDPLADRLEGCAAGQGLIPAGRRHPDGSAPASCGLTAGGHP